jgi:hypothetical protein
MVIHPSDIHEDIGRARIGVMEASRALGIDCDCRLMSLWRVDIDGNEREAFLELAREEAEYDRRD